MSASTISAVRQHPRVRETIDGVEKYCSKCADWWPADTEFWWAQKAGLLGLFGCCKACYYDMDRRPGRTSAQRAVELRA